MKQVITVPIVEDMYKQETSYNKLSLFLRYVDLKLFNTVI